MKKSELRHLIREEIQLLREAKNVEWTPDETKAIKNMVIKLDNKKVTPKLILGDMAIAEFETKLASAKIAKQLLPKATKWKYFYRVEFSVYTGGKKGWEHFSKQTREGFEGEEDLKKLNIAYKILLDLIDTVTD